MNTSNHSRRQHKHLHFRIYAAKKLNLKGLFLELGIQGASRPSFSFALSVNIFSLYTNI